jgi:hypothetical protein
MNLINNFYNFIKEYNTYIYFIPFIYANFYFTGLSITNTILRTAINGYYIYDIYTNKITYISNMINIILTIKIYSTNFIKIFYNEEFALEDAYFYTTLTTKYNITNDIIKKKINKLDINFIKYLIESYEPDFIDSDHNDTRIKLIFYYKNIKYILYYPLKQYFANDDYYIPYPPYNNEIINNYRKDIIIPLFNPTSNPISNPISNKSLLYSLFNIDSKNILKIEIDNSETYINKKNVVRYFEMIKTPFNDFGILYNCPIKLRWILSENNIDISSFKRFYLKFLNMYLNEEILELMEHYIELNNIDNILISNRMKEILLQKNKNLFNE